MLSSLDANRTRSYRHARPADLSAIRTIYNHAVVHTTATMDDEPKSLQEMREWLDEHGGRYPLLVAEVDGEVVGYCCMSRYSSRKGYRGLVEMSVYVHPEHGGRGVGTELVKRTLDAGASSGFHTVLSVITEGNDASVRLFEKLGFEHYGRMHEVGQKHGGRHSLLLLQRFYGSPEQPPR